MAAHDTRLLTNLIKSEKEAQQSFSNYTRDSSNAISALDAWSSSTTGGAVGGGGSGEGKELMETSRKISVLLGACTASQRAYLHSLAAYRTSLKDVLERENSLRTIVRDREILVGRLIKANNKNGGNSESGMENQRIKLEEAKRELEACEKCLQEEELALVGVKRRTFKEAFSMRMRSMGDLGTVMSQSAEEAINLLRQLSSDFPQEYYHERTSTGGDSITPSASASQALSRTSSNTSSNSRPFSTPLPDFTIPSSQSFTSLSNSKSVPFPTSESRRASTATLQPRPISQINNSPALRQPTIRMEVPTAPRPVSSYMNGNDPNYGPTFDIPKAPANVMTQRYNADSSDEEEEREEERRRNNVGMSNGTTSSNAAGRLRKKVQSDTSSVTERTPKAKKSGFFGGLTSLFKKKEKPESNYASGSNSNQVYPTATSTEWTTRTDRNVNKLGAFAGSRATPTPNRRIEEYNDDSDQEDMPRNVIRVVNNPEARMRMRAMSDVGANTTITKGRLEKKKKPRDSDRAASDLGVRNQANYYNSPLPLPPPISASYSAQELAPKRKKKMSTATNTTRNSIYTSPGPAVNPIIVSSPTLNRSISVRTTATNNTTGTTGTTDTKRKKKRTSSASQYPLAIPTAADLASSLPSARSSMSLYANPSTPLYNSSRSLSRQQEEETEDQNAGKIPKSIGRNESRGKKDLARYSNGNWIATPIGTKGYIHPVPNASAAVGSTASTTNNSGSLSKRAGVLEGEESLMSVLDREGREAKIMEIETSRPYTAVPRLSSTLVAGLGPVTVVKRKSVRLAEGGPTILMQITPSPPSSIRSDPSSAPRHGILTNSTQPSQQYLSPNTISHSNSTGSNGGSSTSYGNGNVGGWNTRIARASEIDSSDEDDEYVAARASFARATEGLDSWIGVDGKGKGKGRAVVQD